MEAGDTLYLIYDSIVHRSLKTGSTRFIRNGDRYLSDPRPLIGTMLAPGVCLLNADGYLVVRSVIQALPEIVALIDNPSRKAVGVRGHDDKVDAFMDVMIAYRVLHPEGWPWACIDLTEEALFTIRLAF